MEFKQKIAEMPTTDWDGHYVRTTISLPGAPHTMTSQVIIGWEDIEILRYLHLPKELKHMRPEEARLWIYMNNAKHEEAKKLVEMIAGKIARHLSHSVAETLNEGR